MIEITLRLMMALHYYGLKKTIDKIRKEQHSGSNTRIINSLRCYTYLLLTMLTFT